MLRLRSNSTSSTADCGRDAVLTRAGRSMASSTSSMTRTRNATSAARRRELVWRKFGPIISSAPIPAATSATAA